MTRGTRTTSSVSSANKLASRTMSISASRVTSNPTRYNARGGSAGHMSRAGPPNVSTAVDRDTELALVERLRQGDADAFDDVYAAFNTQLLTFLVRLSRCRDVAEDLLEETWLRLVTHARRLRS